MTEENLPAADAAELDALQKALQLIAADIASMMNGVKLADVNQVLSPISTPHQGPKPGEHG